MSITNDEKFLYSLSSKLDKFTPQGTGTFNFRCPICGDSHKDHNKKRGYIFPDKKNDTLRFKCHNCGESMKFSFFLKTVDPVLFNEYKKENLRPTSKFTQNVTSSFKVKERLTSKSEVGGTFDILLSKGVIVPANKSPKAMEYLTSRLVTNVSNLYFVEKWSSISKTLDTKPSNIHDSRIVIPYTDQSGTVISIQGRDISEKSSIRYITHKFFETDSLYAFNYHLVDTEKPMVILEGAMDSTFIPNSIGCGSYSFMNRFNKDKRVKNKIFIYDNEPGNTDIVKSINASVQEGFKVTLFPSSVDKDINKMIMDGNTIKDVVKLIRDNTYVGIRAKIEVREWLKGK